MSSLQGFCCRVCPVWSERTLHGPQFRNVTCAKASGHGRVKILICTCLGV